LRQDCLVLPGGIVNSLFYIDTAGVLRASHKHGQTDGDEN
jgi:hypothetical protein